jgi:hypothetical protein
MLCFGRKKVWLPYDPHEGVPTLIDFVGPNLPNLVTERDCIDGDVDCAARL